MIIGSICTVPERSDSLLSALTSISEQTIKPDKIVINISEFYPRLGKFYKSWELEKIQKFLETYPIQTIINMGVLDIGPANKLIGPLRSMDLDGEDFIVTFDDDNLLNPRTIEILLKSYRNFPDCVYAMMGVRGGEYYHSETVKETYPDFDYFVVDVVGGFRGVLYKRKLIQPDFFEWVGEISRRHRDLDLMPMHDDQIFSFYFKSRGIQRRVAKYLGEFVPNPYSPIPNGNGIFQDERVTESYDLMVKIIREKGLDWVIDNEY